MIPPRDSIPALAPAPLRDFPALRRILPFTLVYRMRMAGAMLAIVCRIRRGRRDHCLFDLRAGSRTAPIWTPPSDDSRYQIKQIDRDRRPVSAGSTPSGGGRIRTVGPWQPRSAASVDGAAPGVFARTMPISSEACPECPSYFQRNVKANSAQRNAGMMCSANNSIWRISSSHGMNP
jgi:hypothetical protein